MAGSASLSNRQADVFISPMMISHPCWALLVLQLVPSLSILAGSAPPSEAVASSSSTEKLRRPAHVQARLPSVERSPGCLPSAERSLGCLPLAERSPGCLPLVRLLAP